MCSVTTKDDIRIDLYKHRWTRRYLNLDGAGHAYKYRARRLPDGRQSYGWYVPHPALQPALEHLDIYNEIWRPNIERNHPAYTAPGSPSG